MMTDYRVVVSMEIHRSRRFGEFGWVYVTQFMSRICCPEDDFQERAVCTDDSASGTGRKGYRKSAIVQFRQYICSSYEKIIL